MNIFSQSKIFVIAEIANSHEGSLSKAKKLVEYASVAGADAVKFQKFTADELVESNHKDHNLFKNLEMTSKDWKVLINFAKSKKLNVFVDVFGVKSLRSVLKLKIDGLKIHSSDLNNPFLLRLLSKLHYPLLVSAAGANLNEIDESLSVLRKTRKEIVIMHGFQGYPTKVTDLKLNNITDLKRRYNIPIGISDHISGNSELAMIVPLLANALGATIIEKHITLDRSKKGIDYYSALEPDEFKHFVKLVRMSNKALTNGDLSLNMNELEYRKKHKKNAIANYLIKRNTILEEKMFDFKRSNSRSESISYFDFVGKRVEKNIPKGSVITSDFLDKKSHKVVAVLACRIGSGRLFAKPLQPIGDRTILELIISQLKTSSILDEIVLAISENPGNEVFENFAKEKNLKFIRGDDNDVLQRLITSAKFVNAGTILRVTTENPFFYWEGIDNLIKKHHKGSYDLTTYKNMPLGSSLEIIKLNALELSHKSGSSKHRSEFCTLFINQNPKRFKICRIVEKGLNRPDIRLTVDTPQDLWVARIIHNNLGKNKKPIPLRKIIRFLDNNPKIKDINSNIEVEFKIY